MTIPSDDPLELRADRSASPVAPSAMRPFYWSVRRELWENRSLYIAPAAAAAFILLGFLIGLATLSHSLRVAMAMDPGLQGDKLAEPYQFVAMATILTTLVVGVVYCLGALHGERRDRSILFWKSLPVSDLVTVLSKAFVPLVVLPVVAIAITLVTQLAMLLLSTVALSLGGMSAAPVWTQVPWSSLGINLVYGVTVLSVWYAPIWAWLILVSGWARRVTFLWAVLPPLGLCVLEKIAFHSWNLGSLLGRRLFGGYDAAFGEGSRPDPTKFLTSPDVWVGVVVALALFAAAVWLRRRREPI
jgi:ABC-2 type transport system permease protein